MNVKINVRFDWNEREALFEQLVLDVLEKYRSYQKDEYFIAVELWSKQSLKLDLRFEIFSKSINEITLLVREKVSLSMNVSEGDLSAAIDSVADRAFKGLLC